MVEKIKVIIAGAQGYVGRELMALINQHPYLSLAGIHVRQDKDESCKFMPQILKNTIPVYSTKDLLLHAAQIDILLLATPTTVSMELVAALAHTNIVIIDLSGAFRLPEASFKEWYGISHEAPQFINEASYGLSPWVTLQSHDRLVANPGCYATCALMSLIPLIKAKLINSDQIIIDAKSGVSGGGKQANPELMFCEIANNFLPYKIGKHQHTPEIKKGLYELAGDAANIRLMTSILPIVRGISMNIYAKANAAFSSDEAISAAINDALIAAYQDYPLLNYQEVGKTTPKDDEFILSLKSVVQTPNMHIGYFVKDGLIILFSSLDNLLKGAASQSIENINAIYHLPLQTGLLPVKGVS